MTLEEALERFMYRPDEEVGPFLSSDHEGRLTPVPRRAAVLEEFLAFRLEAETYAVPIGALREILRVPLLTRLPRAGAHVLGLMNLRGEMLPVYDVRQRLKLGAGDSRRRKARVVVVRGLAGDAGMLVDEVEGVVRLPVDGLEAPPLAGLERDGVAGVGRLGRALYILLDVERVLDG